MHRVEKRFMKVSEEVWKAIIGADNSSDIAEGEKLRGGVTSTRG